MDLFYPLKLYQVIHLTIKERFKNFNANIRPSSDHLKEARRQTDYMVEQLHNKIASDGRFELLKILRAGSNAKHTSLLRTETNIFDVDLGAYFSGEDAKKSELDSLLKFTREKLIEIYKNVKEEKDFEVLKSAVRVDFKSGIELWVDVAPIVKDDSLGIEDGGWIPRDDGIWRLTSVSAHNRFVSDRNKASKVRPGPVHFNGLVRMMKWWTNRLGEDLRQPAILTESLVAAAIAQNGGVTDEWQTSLRHIFKFARTHRFEYPIFFEDHYKRRDFAMPKDTVVVLDSVNATNNVAREWTSSTREAYLEAINDAYFASNRAWSAEIDHDDNEALFEWCQVFGPMFEQLSEAEDNS